LTNGAVETGYSHIGGKLDPYLSPCIKINSSQVWWPTPIILALGRQGQKDLEFKVTLGYIGSSRPFWAT
jgi:hypothetical protein